MLLSSAAKYMIDGFKGANVETTDGKTFPVKTSLAVPAGSAELPAARTTSIGTAMFGIVDA